MPHILPPCGKNCPNRGPACQSDCEAYREYRAALDEDAKKLRDHKAKRRCWTESRVKAMGKREEFRKKLQSGRVHNK